MSPRFLLDHFELLAEAPGGVARLRELVLHLAVRGKLVPQDPADEPASELLKRIAKERARLVKEGKIRAGKPLPPVGAEEVPFEVPEGWVWCRLGELCSHGPSNGWSPQTVGHETAVKTLKLSATTRGIFDSSQTKFIDADLPKDSEYWLQDGDLLIQRSNTRDYVGMAALYSGPETTFIYPDLMMRCRIFSLVSRSYVHRALVSPSGREYLQARASGTSSSMVKINQNTVVACSIPLPPLAEQHRIVARVDELMALLDRLEAARGERDTTRLAARDSALAALRDAADASEVAAAWRRLEARLDDLFQAPEDVPPLRQAILQLAVRGRLVAQDPADEPASELLKRIASERARLVKEGKIRAGKPLPPVGADEEPFEVPAGWVWGRLGDVAYVAMGNSPPGDTYNSRGEGVPLINGPVEFSPGAFGFTQKGKYTTAPSQLCGEGDLLVCVRGATTGRTNISAFSACIGRGVALVRAWEAQPYINLVMWWSGSRLLEAGKGTTFPSISYIDLAGMSVGLPPLAEQHRIVARVDALMVLCDRLESRLAAARDAQTALAAAAVHHLEV